MAEGPAQWLSPSLPAPKGLSISGGTGHYSDEDLVLLAELELMAFGTGDGIFDGSQLRTGEVL